MVKNVANLGKVYEKVYEISPVNFLVWFVEMTTPPHPFCYVTVGGKVARDQILLGQIYSLIWHLNYLMIEFIRLRVVKDINDSLLPRPLSS